jgi:hypothetical protein
MSPPEGALSRELSHRVPTGSGSHGGAALAFPATQQRRSPADEQSERAARCRLRRGGPGWHLTAHRGSRRQPKTGGQAARSRH